MTTREQRAVRELVDHQKRSWRWKYINGFDSGVGEGNKVRKPMVKPTGTVVSRSGGATALEHDVMTAKDITLQVSVLMTGISGHGTCQGRIAWYRTIENWNPQNADEVQQETNPRLVWDMRPFQVHQEADWAHAVLLPERRWRQVSVGLGSEFGFIVWIDELTSAANAQVYTSWTLLEEESGLEFRAI